mgnify:CR=1 FL=1
MEEIRKSLPNIDCGACGAPSCEALAEDIVHDEAHLEDCVLLALRTLRDGQNKVWDVRTADGGKNR